MAVPVLEIIKNAVDAAKVLVDKAETIIVNNQNMIEETDQRNYSLACECINSYKREISIIEDQIKTQDLPQEIIERYLDKINNICKDIEAFVMKWSLQENTEKKNYADQNKKILLAALGILTGGLGLVPYAIAENKKHKK